jgi:hypothetical protein
MRSLRIVLALAACLLVTVHADSLESGVDVDADLDVEVESESEAASPFYTDFKGPGGYPKQGGGEEWIMETNTFVANMWSANGCSNGRARMHGRNAHIPFCVVRLQGWSRDWQCRSWFSLDDRTIYLREGQI